jgi:hypothetical protein
VTAHLVEALHYKAVVSIPDGFIAIFLCWNSSGFTMTLGLTQQ